jgi:hypothetical protein
MVDREYIVFMAYTYYLFTITGNIYLPLPENIYYRGMTLQAWVGTDRAKYILGRYDIKVRLTSPDIRGVSIYDRRLV